jgi:hypothetical protein
MRQENIRALWVADHYDGRIPSLIAERTGGTFLHVPVYTGATETTSDYFALVDTWIQAMKSAFPDCQQN